jgi:signal transduction histidine kinase/PAS domain-containing protein
MTPSALEELLARLQRQEQRTAALEAVLLESQPTLHAPVSLAHSLAQTPSVRPAETPVAPKPKRDPSDDRAARPGKPDAPGSATPSALSPAAVLASLDDVVWSVSPDGQLVFFVGGAVERLYGITEHELHDERGRWLETVPPEDRARLRTALARLPETDTFTLDHRIERAEAASGRRWARTRGKLVRDRDGRPVRVDGITNDVTRPARAREAVLAVLEGTGPTTGSEFLARLVRHLCGACEVRVAVVVEPHPHDPSEARTAAAWVGGRLAEPAALTARTGLARELLSGGRAFAPAAARARHPADPLLFQLRAEAFAAEPLVDGSGGVLGFLALADDRPFAADTDVRALLKALAPRAAVELGLARAERHTGELHARVAAAERRATEAEGLLRGAADLAAVGRLAAGAAHDFNNLLGVVVGNADLIREALPADDPNREAVEAIARAAHTVAGVSRKLLTIGRPGPLRVAPLDVAAALRTLEPVLRRLTGKALPLEFELAPELPLVRADATQFDRVVLNLVLNARDAVEAMPGGRGTVTVRAAVAVVEPDRPAWPADRAPGKYVALTVADSGCGMSAAVREQMFQVFFTTKGARGTGLGLATVHDAVTAARGHIEVESQVGWGTQIRIYWPADSGRNE